MVLIRLLNRNHPDTLTWTWNQKPNDSWILLWMTLCQFNTKMEVEKVFKNVIKVNSLGFWVFDVFKYSKDLYFLNLFKDQTVKKSLPKNMLSQ